MVTMFEEAFKLQPTNEELGAQTFFANVRAGRWKSAQQVKYSILFSWLSGCPTFQGLRYLFYIC
jgi:hypothetical protein